MRKLLNNLYRVYALLNNMFQKLLLIFPFQNFFKKKKCIFLLTLKNIYTKQKHSLNKINSVLQTPLWSSVAAVFQTLFSILPKEVTFRTNIPLSRYYIHTYINILSFCTKDIKTSVIFDYLWKPNLSKIMLFFCTSVVFIYIFLVNCFIFNIFLFNSVNDFILILENKDGSVIISLNKSITYASEIKKGHLFFCCLLFGFGFVSGPHPAFSWYSWLWAKKRTPSRSRGHGLAEDKCPSCCATAIAWIFTSVFAQWYINRYKYVYVFFQ